MTGNLVKLSANFDGEIRSDGDQFHAVVITGAADYIMPESEEIKSLVPGSYFTSKGKSRHKILGSTDLETTIYIRTNGTFRIK